MRWCDHALFEAWAHEASLLPVRFEPLLRWRQASIRAAASIPGKAFHGAFQMPQLVDAVLTEIRENGAMAGSELRHLEVNPKQAGSWWNWSAVKRVLEYLFATGQLHVAERRSFERRYDLPERVLPADILNTPTPDEAAARRALLRRQRTRRRHCLRPLRLLPHAEDGAGTPSRRPTSQSPGRGPT